MIPAPDIEWTVITVLDSAAQTGVSVATAVLARKEALRQLCALLPADAAKAKLAEKKITTPRTQRYGEWQIDVAPRAHLRIVLHDRAQDLPVSP